MTKEEYSKLLQSDYWRGYSYSLIKERNFTCEDCGRRFPYERNMLQVHHLVYRDIMPWSYEPHEVVVLCKNCHQRRHGAVPEVEAGNTRTAVENTRYDAGNSRKDEIYEKEVERPSFVKRWFSFNRIMIYVIVLCLVMGVSSLFVKEATSEDVRASAQDVVADTLVAVDKTEVVDHHDSKKEEKKEKHHKEEMDEEVPEGPTGAIPTYRVVGRGRLDDGELVAVSSSAPIHAEPKEAAREKLTVVDNRVYDVVDEMPGFPGGPSALMQYLASNIKYPVVAQENEVQGRVIVGFVVDTDGSVSDVRVIKGVDPSLDREAERVVKNMPKWIPGKTGGQTVRVKYNIPVSFKLQ